MGPRSHAVCHFCKTAGMDPVEHTALEEADQRREATMKCPYRFASSFIEVLRTILPQTRQPKVDTVYAVNYESDGYAALVSSLLSFGRLCKDDGRSVRQQALRQIVGMAGAVLGNPGS